MFFSHRSPLTCSFVFLFSSLPDSRDFSSFLLQLSTHRPTNLAVKPVSSSLTSYSVFTQQYIGVDRVCSAKQVSFFLQPRDYSFANSSRDSRWSESPHYLITNIFPVSFTRSESQHLFRLFIPRFTSRIIRIDAPLAYRTTSHRVSYDGKGWIVHEIIRASNLNALPRNRESSDINCRDKKSRGVTRKRAIFGRN